MRLPEYHEESNKAVSGGSWTFDVPSVLTKNEAADQQHKQFIS